MMTTKKQSAAATHVTTSKSVVSDTKEVKAVAAAPAKEETKAVEKTEAPAKKTTTAKKAPAKKAPAKKTTTRTTTKKAVAKKEEIKLEVYVEYIGKQVSEKDMVENAKKSWAYDYKKDESEIKSLSLYIKPEDNSVYYVVNGTDDGRIDF